MEKVETIKKMLGKTQEISLPEISFQNFFYKHKKCNFWLQTYKIHIYSRILYDFEKNDIKRCPNT